MFNKTGRSVRLLSFKDDQPQEIRGSLIPRVVRDKMPTRAERTKKLVVTSVKVALPVAALALFGFIGITGYGLVASNQQIASPTVTIIDPNTTTEVTLEYGPHSAFSNRTFFEETRAAFVDKSISFIEVDFEEQMVRLFKEGVLTESIPVEQFGKAGSWWDAPSGLYEVDNKDKREFSTLAQVYFPWAITFEGNYAIHGVPEFPDGTQVGSDFENGGIRIANDKAEALFKEVVAGMPVLVYQKTKEKDHFVYTATVQNISAPHYLIADIETGTMLAASDLATPVPIASLTKLMTAVIASEKLDLDGRVQVTSPNFVQSLIPRLQDRTSVGVYSLLQLLLVESSNEAAEVIAGEYGRAAFIEEMNAKAKQLGMFQTAYTDPSGLDNGNISTLQDLFLLTQYIHENRTFIFDITAKEKATGARDTGEFSDLNNFNDVEDLNNFVGGKIGETTAAGKTSVSLHDVSIQGNTRTVAIILLGAETRDADVRALVEFVEGQYRP